MKKIFTLETLYREKQQPIDLLSLTNLAKAWPIQPTPATNK